jgi:hypothetical protein
MRRTSHRSGSQNSATSFDLAEGIARNERINPVQSKLLQLRLAISGFLQGPSLRAPMLKSLGAVRWFPPSSAQTATALEAFIEAAQARGLRINNFDQLEDGWPAPMSTIGNSFTCPPRPSRCRTTAKQKGNRAKTLNPQWAASELAEKIAALPAGHPYFGAATKNAYLFTPTEAERDLIVQALRAFATAPRTGVHHESAMTDMVQILAVTTQRARTDFMRTLNQPT